MQPCSRIHGMWIFMALGILGVIWFLGCSCCVEFVMLNERHSHASNVTPQCKRLSSTHPDHHSALTRLDPVLLPKSQAKLFVNATTMTFTCDRGKAYIVHTNYPWRVVVPSWDDENDGDKVTNITKWKSESGVVEGSMLRSNLHFLLATTLSQSKQHYCNILAMNGGPFARDGWSTGPTMVDGKLVRTHKDSMDTKFVGIGTTANGEWALGTYGDITKVLTNYENDNLQNHLQHFVTGFGWLVYNQQVVANNTLNPTGADHAPRTAIGLDMTFNLLLVVVDGCKFCPHRKGPTLEELAAFLLKHGAFYAINMDGGGSSTMVRNSNQVWNNPTCLDVPFPSCQRKVVTVHCISSPTNG